MGQRNCGTRFYQLVDLSDGCCEAAGAPTQNHHEPISPDSNYMLHQMKQFKELLTDIGYEGRTYITEFNVTILSRDIINDTAFKGSYILKNVLAVVPYCDLIGYWQLTDLSVTTFDTANKEIFGGSGLISKAGSLKSATMPIAFK